MRRNKWLLWVFLWTILIPAGYVQAQTPTPGDATYVVQAGDSLWGIAQRFRVSLEELAALNNITNASQLMVGAELKIPGLPNFSGRLTTITVPYGENLISLSRRYGLSAPLLAQLNHLMSPHELVAGSYLVIPEEKAEMGIYQRSFLSEGQSLLEFAILHQVNPWQVAVQNQLSDTLRLTPSRLLLLPGEGAGMSALPEQIKDITVAPLPFLQGKTAVMKMEAEKGVNMSGSFMGRELHFFEDENGLLVTLLGVHAMAEPGVYPFEIHQSTGENIDFSYSQMVAVGKVDYPYDDPLSVDPETIDPAVTEPESELWASYAQPITKEKYWQGGFRLPSPLSLDYCLTTNDCWSSRFGNRRSYNGSTYNTFHSGLDIVGGEGTEIYAPAAGVVVFAGPLTVRGNATMIDHGWGVYSGYYHQKEIYVKVGDKVEAGQLIGIVGSTGRVEGPHLHWEIWVNGVQVDPLDWLKQVFP
jgi:murein DD-endopeptidase MepM/ murein hydrolase activator NlpD